MQKWLGSRRTVVLFSLGTSGIHNNRRPLDREEPHQYAYPGVYPDRLGSLALKHVKTGSVLYLEGNLETKVLCDPIARLVRRIREIALRGNVFRCWIAIQTHLDGNRRFEVSSTKRTVESSAQQTKITSQFSEV